MVTDFCDNLYFVDGIGDVWNHVTLARGQGHRIRGVHKVQQISCGSSHVAMVDYFGSLWTLGENYQGQLGYETNNPRDNPIPRRVSNLPPVSFVSCGFFFTCCISYEKELWCFGDNNYGQLGIMGMSSVDQTPTCVPNMNNVRKIACGTSHTVILIEDGSILSAGVNLKGQLGIGNSSNIESNETFQVVKKSEYITVKDIGCTSDTSIFLRSNGQVYACGNFAHFQAKYRPASDDSVISYYEMVCIPGISDVTSVNCGYTRLSLFSNEKTIRLDFGASADVPASIRMSRGFSNLSVFQDKEGYIHGYQNQAILPATNFPLFSDLEMIKRIDEESMMIDNLVNVLGHFESMLLTVLG